MKSSLAVLFLFILNAGLAHSDYLDDYFELIVRNFNEQLKDYGITKLPIADRTYIVNRTIVPGLHLEGTVAYQNGIVSDMDDFFSVVDGHKGGVDENGADLFYQIDLPNITVFFDVTAEMKEQGNGQGTAELLFGNTTIGFHFSYDYNNQKKVVELEPWIAPAPSTNFLPDTDLMRAVARLARLEMAAEFLWDQLIDWNNNVFEDMLTKALDQIPFPIVPPNE